MGLRGLESSKNVKGNEAVEATWVYGSGFRAWDLGLRVWGLGVEG